MSTTSATQRTRVSLAPGYAGEGAGALSGRGGALSERGGAYQRGVLLKRGFQTAR
jgi:hypothetical protein